METSLDNIQAVKTARWGTCPVHKSCCRAVQRKNITFGSLQKRISGEVKSMGPGSGGKGRPRILPRDVEGEHCF